MTRPLIINAADAVWNDTTAREVRRNNANSLAKVRAKLANNNKPSIWSRIADFFDMI